MTHPFFKNKGPFKINNLLNLSGIKSIKKFKNIKIFDVKDLLTSTKKNITFFILKNI